MDSNNIFQKMADAETNPQGQSQAQNQTATPQPSAPQPQSQSGNVFELMAQQEKSQSSGPPQQSAKDSNSDAAKELAHKQAVGKHGLLARAWDWVNQPIFDNILPRDIKTSDIVKAAAFEKMFGVRRGSGLLRRLHLDLVREAAHGSGAQAVRASP